MRYFPVIVRFRLAGYLRMDLRRLLSPPVLNRVYHYAGAAKAVYQPPQGSPRFTIYTNVTYPVPAWRYC
ncbi:MAG TPA: hypothetical protein VF690_07165 [Hymenobacter sp.]|jgi:hypothetical protein